MRVEGSQYIDTQTNSRMKENITMSCQVLCLSNPPHPHPLPWTHRCPVSPQRARWFLAKLRVPWFPLSPVSTPLKGRSKRSTDSHGSAGLLTTDPGPRETRTQSVTLSQDKQGPCDIGLAFYSTHSLSTALDPLVLTNALSLCPLGGK